MTNPLPLIIFHHKVPGRQEMFCLRGQLASCSGLGAPPMHVPAFRDLPLISIGAEVPFVEFERVMARYTPEFYPEQIPALITDLVAINCHATNLANASSSHAVDPE